MPSANAAEKIACSTCGKVFRRNNLARHKLKCKNEQRFHCTTCNKFSSTCQADLDYHVARPHAPDPITSDHECAICREVFQGPYQLQRHKQQVHGTTRRTTNNYNDLDLTAVTDNAAAREALQDYKHLLVDSDTTTKLQRVVNFPLCEYNTTVRHNWTTVRYYC